MRSLFVWFRVAREHEAAVVEAVHELHGRWIAQGLHCELLRRADGAEAGTTLMEIYRAAGGVDAHWQERIEREANERLAPWLSGARHVEVFEPVSTPCPAGGTGSERPCA